MTLRARVEMGNPALGLPGELWFRYPARFQPWISNRADAFLGALVLVAQACGEDIDCRGECSPRLLYHLEEYRQIFTHWRPAVFRPIQVRASALSPAPAPIQPGRYATAFSGGVDSLYTLRCALDPQAEHPAWNVRYGLFMQGSSDIPLSYTEKYTALARRYGALFEELGLELITARTNLLQFKPPALEFKSFLEAPLVGAGLGLDRLLAGIFMPSGRLYERYVDNTTGPITTHLLATEAFESYDSGSDMTRFDKVRAIAAWEPARQNLRVCLGYTSASIEDNCEVCPKCHRVRMVLHILVQLDKFQTFKRPFAWKDYLLWGRWVEAGFGYETDVLRYVWRERKALLLPVLVGVVVAAVRNGLKQALPARIKEWIYTRSSPRTNRALLTKVLDVPDDQFMKGNEDAEKRG